MGAQVKVSPKLKRLKQEFEEDEEWEDEEGEIEAEHQIGFMKGLTMLLVLLGIFLVLTQSQIIGISVPVSSTNTYVVQKGDSLWSIVKKQYPHDNLSVKVQEIQERNHLHGNQIQVGQQLILP